MNAERRLKLLGNLFYVLVALGAVASFVMPVIVMRGSVDPRGILIAAIVAGLIGSLFLVGLYGSVGWAIHRRKWHLYCMVISGLLCLSFPLGTALGVFSLITLSKPEIRRLFEGQTQK
jgi:hypothetical protein